MDIGRDVTQLVRWELPENADEWFIPKSFSKMVQSSVTGNLSILSLLQEIGPTSGQCYMGADCNHRNLNMAFWTGAPNSNQRPLIDSLVWGTDTEHFDVSNFMCYYFHSVHDNNTGADRILMETNCNVLLKSNDKTLIEKAQLGNRFMDILRGPEFNRVLLFFNRRWYRDGVEVDPSKTDPSVNELAYFCYMLGQHPVYSVEQWELFLKEFSLEEFITFPALLSMEDRAFVFSLTFRLTTQIRFTVYDGQHRSNLMTLFSQGYYDPVNNMIMDRSVFDEWKERTGRDEADFSASQIFAKLTFKVGLAVQVEGIKYLAKVLHGAGRRLTAGGDLSVPCTWKEITDDIFSKVVNNAEIVVLDYDNFWKDSDSSLDAVDSNLHVIWGIIKKVLGGDVRKQNVIMGQSKMEFPNMSTELENKLTKVGNVVGKGKIPAKTSSMLQLIRSVCFDPVTVKRFQSIFLAVRPNWNSRGDYAMKNILGLASDEWLDSNVVHTALEVNNYYVEKIMCEIVLVTYLRANQNNPVQDPSKDFARMATTGIIPASIRVPNFPSEGESITYSKLNLTNSNWFMQRVNFAGMNSFISDIFEAIQQFGFDPDFAKNPVDPCNIENPNLVGVDTPERKRITRFERDYASLIETYRNWIAVYYAIKAELDDPDRVTTVPTADGSDTGDPFDDELGDDPVGKLVEESKLEHQKMVDEFRRLKEAGLADAAEANADKARRRAEGEDDVSDDITFKTDDLSVEKPDDLDDDHWLEQFVPDVDFEDPNDFSMKELVSDDHCIWAMLCVKEELLKLKKRMCVPLALEQRRKELAAACRVVKAEIQSLIQKKEDTSERDAYFAKLTEERNALDAEIKSLQDKLELPIKIMKPKVVAAPAMNLLLREYLE